jgi:hypothetical protein
MVKRVLYNHRVCFIAIQTMSDACSSKLQVCLLTQQIAVGSWHVGSEGAAHCICIVQLLC